MAEFVEYTVPEWRGLDMRELYVDEAYVLGQSDYEEPAYLYMRSDECYMCPYSHVETLHNLTLKLNVARGCAFKIFNADMGAFVNDNPPCLNASCGAVCSLYSSAMQEFGVYNLTLQQNGTCDLNTDKPGVNVNLALGAVLLLVALILLVVRVSWYAWRLCHYSPVAVVTVTQTELLSTESSTSAVVAVAQRRRMTSLDAFRGMSIVLMIFVNSGGGDYWWIKHAHWNGLHLADIVFPTFLWIMGVCIPISVKSQITRGVGISKICKRICWRSLKLFMLGLCLNSKYNPQFSDLRIMGVLQRFAVAYLVCGILHTLFTQKDTAKPQVAWKRAMCDLLLFKWEFTVMLILIVLHFSIVFGLPVPGCPTGYLGPGGRHTYAQYPNCTGGATGYIDRKMLGTSHMFQYLKIRYIYGAQVFDPEGLFGCLLTIVHAFLGVLAGVIILVHTEWQARIKRWLCWSLGLALLGGTLCYFGGETGLIPINKRLWSLSFVSVTTALAFAVLTILYFIIDVQCWWSGSPFVEAGMNSILMYVGHKLIRGMLPWHWRIGPMNTHFVLLLESTWNTMLWIGIALYLDFIKFYYSV